MYIQIYTYMCIHSDGCMCVDMRAYVPAPARAPGAHTLSGYSEYSPGTVRGH